MLEAGIGGKALTDMVSITSFFHVDGALIVQCLVGSRVCRDRELKSLDLLKVTRQINKFLHATRPTGHVSSEGHLGRRKGFGSSLAVLG